MIGLRKERATALIKGLRDSDSLPNGWTATDADTQVLESVVDKVAKRQKLLVNDTDIKNIIEECCRCDTKTHRPITQGYMICGSKYFAEESDAVEWFNNNGIPFDTFDKCALEAERLQWHKADWTYWNNWHDSEYKYIRK